MPPSKTLNPVAWLPIGLAAVAADVVLAATSNQYGYHRDELYFRMLEPAWGYVDQPLLTPMLARASIAVFGDTVWGIRVPSLLFVAATIVFTALITRELGGGRTAQSLSAFGIAFASVPLAGGHLLSTGTADFAFGAAVLLCIARALMREQPHWWLIAGAVVGVSLYNKLLVTLTLIAVAVGLAIVGPRQVLRSRSVWLGVGIALVVGSPSLMYQATHGFPQLTMAGALVENNADDVRLQLLPFQLILLGLGLVPIWVAGLVGLVRREQWRPVRAMAVAYPVAVLLNLIGAGQVYYALVALLFAFAAGCVPAAQWAADRRVRAGLLAAAVAVNSAVSVLISLPVVPLTSVGSTPIAAINPTLGDQVGWPVYIDTLAAAYQSLPAADQARAVIFTGNYGEAGAVARYGPEHGLPAAYSGQNELYYHGPPPESASVVLAWTQNFARLSTRFEDCRQLAVMDNGVDVDNEEQGSVVAVCRVPAGGWAALWPSLQHYD